MATKLKTLEDRLARLEAQMNVSASVPVVPQEPVEVKPKTKRAPSAYNTFMKDEIARLKNEVKEGELFDRKHAFKQAANNWSAHKASSS